jgi:hypothetical protein
MHIRMNSRHHTQDLLFTQAVHPSRALVPEGFLQSRFFNTPNQQAATFKTIQDT